MKLSYLDLMTTDPSYNLAMEQYVFDCLPRDRMYFMLWQNDNAIIVGKYQNTIAEINEEAVRERGIRVVRRLSGGGAVYHDMGNLNFTFITDVGESNALDLKLFCEPVVRTLATLGMPHARERERQLHVFQNGLMRNEVIALEHKADAVVAVGIPIAIVKVFGRNTVDQQVARIEMIEPTDNVEHRSFARPRRSQNGHELVIAKRQAHAVERHLRKRLRNVPFANTFELQHGRQPLLRRHPARSPPPFVFDAFVLLYPHFLPTPVRNVTNRAKKRTGRRPKEEVPSGTSIWWSLS